MAKDPDDMVMSMLGEIRREIGEMKQQLDKLKSGQKTIRQALSADTMMSKFVTGDFEERVLEP
jgi:hypothetical protein